MIAISDSELQSSFDLAMNIFCGPPSIPSFFYNEARSLEPYQGSVESYMNSQRNHVAIGDLRGRPRGDFVRSSTMRPPIGGFCAGAAPFESPIYSTVRQIRRVKLDHCGRRQSERLRRLVSDRADLGRRWRDFAPPELADFHRRLPLGVWWRFYTFSILAPLTDRAIYLRYAHCRVDAASIRFSARYGNAPCSNGFRLSPRFT